ncbi:hypothetical protein O6H91_14G072000 [Diphasiastrum complanatum]|uniref:Uncharacterized protein n=1 Tax=Diphasiastrum complanatum TaxID=34168 RepID=A0ACC2BQQ1_DIPCM|nr:hypothetical protein O6H91_14G072000 [Diphasiastrum complanatum]
MRSRYYKSNHGYWKMLDPKNEFRILVLSICFFVAIYTVVCLTLFRRWKGRKRQRAASCCISLVHGTISATLAAHDMACRRSSASWKLDARNSSFQNGVMEFSMAYFLVDLLHYLYAVPDDYLFIGHHISTLTYMLSCRYFTRHGATSVMYLIAVGEATTPLQCVWNLSRMAREDHRLAMQIYTFLSPIFTVIFTFVRGCLGPYLLWKLSSFYLRGQSSSSVIPRWLAYFWMLKAALAVVGSLLWVYKLWVGLFKFYTQKQYEVRKVE